MYYNNHRQTHFSDSNWTDYWVVGWRRWLTAAGAASVQRYITEWKPFLVLCFWSAPTILHSRILFDYFVLFQFRFRSETNRVNKTINDYVVCLANWPIESSFSVTLVKYTLLYGRNGWLWTISAAILGISKINSNIFNNVRQKYRFKLSLHAAPTGNRSNKRWTE